MGVMISGCADAPTAPLSAPVAPVALQSGEVPIVISAVIVANGSEYVAVTGGLVGSARVYTDRIYTYRGVPAELQGQSYIRTREGDRAVSGNPQSR